MEPVYTPVIAAALTLFRAFGWNIRASGGEHIPASGGAVIATNHVGYLDFAFVGYGVMKQRRRLVRFLAKAEVFHHWAGGPLMRGMKHIPVDRFGAPGAAFTAAVGALRRGEVISMFPEATISRSFVPAAGKQGAARMAMTAGVPLIPGAVWGSQRILTKGHRPNWQRNVAISVDFGPPVAYAPGEHAGEVTSRLMAAVTDLTDRAARRYPQQPRDENDRWWLPAHLGGTAPTVADAEAAAAQELAERLAARRAAREHAASTTRTQ